MNPSRDGGSADGVAYQHSYSNRLYCDTPKTETSVRWISLPPETMQLLKRYRAWQMEESLRLGDYWKDLGFVFTQDNGQPMHPDSVTD